jgi:hypothetical protein
MFFKIIYIYIYKKIPLSKKSNVAASQRTESCPQVDGIVKFLSWLLPQLAP